MTNNCVVCGATIPEGLQVCPNCEKKEIIRMKWEQVAFCDWEAKGSEGDFRVWKDGKVWKGRYRSADKNKLFFLPIQKSEKAIKKLCEENHYWE